MDISYDNTVVMYSGIGPGTIDPSGMTIIANNHGTWVEYTCQGYPGVTGPGSFVVLQFRSLTGATPNESMFAPTSTNFANCNIPPGSFSPAYSYNVNCH
jgi:hypothetical protein